MALSPLLPSHAVAISTFLNISWHTSRTFQLVRLIRISRNPKFCIHFGTISRHNLNNAIILFEAIFSYSLLLYNIANCELQYISTYTSSITVSTTEIKTPLPQRE